MEISSDHCRSVHVVTWRDRSGEKPDRNEYFPSMNYGINAAKTFALSNLHIFSDSVIPGVEDSGINCSVIIMIMLVLLA